MKHHGLVLNNAIKHFIQRKMQKFTWKLFRVGKGDTSSGKKQVSRSVFISEKGLFFQLEITVM